MDTDNNNPDESLFVYEVRTDSNHVARLIKEEVYWSAWDNCWMTIDTEVVSVGEYTQEYYEDEAKRYNSQLPQNVKNQMGLK